MKTDKIIETLNRSTKSPGEGFGAEENFNDLMNRISPQIQLEPKKKNHFKRYISVAAASIIIFISVAGSAYHFHSAKNIPSESNISEIISDYPNLNTEKNVWFFNNVDLNQILTQLSSYYNVEINIENYKYSRNIRAEFSEDDDIYNIISLLMLASEYDYTLKEDANYINIILENY